MIQVTVKRNGQYIQLIELTGHAESGPYGYDLVCAGVSAVSIGTVNAVMELTDIDINVEQGREGGYLLVTIPEMLHGKDMEKAQLLFEGMLVSLKSIENDYGNFIYIQDE